MGGEARAALVWLSVTGECRHIQFVRSELAMSAVEVPRWMLKAPELALTHPPVSGRLYTTPSQQSALLTQDVMKLATAGLPSWRREQMMHYAFQTRGRSSTSNSALRRRSRLPALEVPKKHNPKMLLRYGKTGQQFQCYRYGILSSISLMR